MRSYTAKKFKIQSIQLHLLGKISKNKLVKHNQPLKLKIISSSKKNIRSKSIPSDSNDTKRSENDYESVVQFQGQLSNNREKTEKFNAKYPNLVNEIRKIKKFTERQKNCKAQNIEIISKSLINQNILRSKEFQTDQKRFREQRYRKGLTALQKHNLNRKDAFCLEMVPRILTPNISFPSTILRSQYDRKENKINKKQGKSYQINKMFSLLNLNRQESKIKQEKLIQKIALQTSQKIKQIQTRIAPWRRYNFEQDLNIQIQI